MVRCLSEWGLWAVISQMRMNSRVNPSLQRRRFHGHYNIRYDGVTKA